MSINIDVLEREDVREIAASVCSERIQEAIDCLDIENEVREAIDNFDMENEIENKVEEVIDEKVSSVVNDIEKSVSYLEQQVQELDERIVDIEKHKESISTCHPAVVGRLDQHEAQMRVLQHNNDTLTYLVKLLQHNVTSLRKLLASAEPEKEEENRDDTGPM